MVLQHLCRPLPFVNIRHDHHCPLHYVACTPPAFYCINLQNDAARTAPVALHREPCPHLSPPGFRTVDIPLPPPTVEPPISHFGAHSIHVPATSGRQRYAYRTLPPHTANLPVASSLVAPYNTFTAPLHSNAVNILPDYYQHQLTTPHPSTGSAV